MQKKNQYLIPFILVTTLFFLWGLANILNSALIAQFQPVFEISRAQALLVETAFYFSGWRIFKVFPVWQLNAFKGSPNGKHAPEIIS